jgi:ABC-type bacteriocin/lantibiotic exporter with double-glycine peptidase domain
MIAPKHVRLTKINRKDGRVQYSVKPLDTTLQYKVFINKQTIKKETVVSQDDELAIGDYKVVFEPRSDAISMQKIEYFSLHVENLIYKIKNNLLIDSVTFSAESNEFICIMGPSGCGKSTLLELIFGAKRQTSGNILYNHENLHENLEFYRNIFGFVPQDDVLFGNLTVYENLYFAAKLREPFIAKKKIEKKSILF